jgi:hypothetical protein
VRILGSVVQSLVLAMLNAGHGDARGTAHAGKLLDGPAVSYGKGAVVGVAGEMEHGGACVHPMLGKPMRAASAAARR